MFVVVTRLSNDESARSPTLLKLVFTTDIIDQVHKFWNSYFKNACEGLLLFYKKHVFQEHTMKYVCDRILQKTLPLKLTETLNASTFVSTFLNIV